MEVKRTLGELLGGTEIPHVEWLVEKCGDTEIRIPIQDDEVRALFRSLRKRELENQARNQILSFGCYEAGDDDEANAAIERWFFERYGVSVVALANGTGANCEALRDRIIERCLDIIDSLAKSNGAEKNTDRHLTYDNIWQTAIARVLDEHLEEKS